MTNENSDAQGLRGPANRLALGEIPELARPVGLYGTLRHVEVGGSYCFGIVITLAIYANNGG